jgi:hypothetical protein
MCRGSTRKDFSPKRFFPIPNELRPMFEVQRRIANELIQGVQTTLTKPIEIIFDYIDDGTADAFSAVHNKKGFVALNRGVILILIDTLYRMLSHPKVLPQIGASSEKENEQHQEGIIDD